MPKNSPALPERLGPRRSRPPLFPGINAPGNFCMGVILFSFFFLAAEIVYAQAPASGDAGIRWYRTNLSGMALEFIPSRLAAMRNEYCLSVESISPRDLPVLLTPYYEDPYTIELRTIYEKGKEYRRQWIFRDNAAQVRLTASGTIGLFDGKDSEDSKGSGFIEFLDSDGTVSREITFAEDLSQSEFRFSYKDNILLKTETWYKAPPAPPPAQTVETDETDENPADKDQAGTIPPDETSVDTQPSDENPSDENPADVKPAVDEKDIDFVPVSTDTYLYTRSLSLRAIERTLLEGGNNLSRISFPPIGSQIPSGTELITNDNAFSSEFLSDIQSPEGITINYTLDDRGRIVGEVWKDKDGVLFGELQNTWSGSKLQSVLWKTDEQERLVEYEYDDAGNRTVERDYNHGVLERSVTSRDGRDVEELYLNGKVVLRAYWENGEKVSEERVSR